VFLSSHCGWPPSCKSVDNGVDDSSKSWVLWSSLGIVVDLLSPNWSFICSGSLLVLPRTSILWGPFSLSWSFHESLWMFSLNELLYLILKRHTLLRIVAVVLVKMAMLSCIGVLWNGHFLGVWRSVACKASSSIRLLFTLRGVYCVNLDNLMSLCLAYGGGGGLLFSLGLAFSVVGLVLTWFLNSLNSSSYMNLIALLLNSSKLDAGSM